MGYTALGLVETGFQIYDRLTGSISRQLFPDLGPGVRSWTVHHALRPGYDVPPTRTNSFGLRSPEVAVPKPAGTRRVLLLGDSFTFGFQAGEDVVFARQLERLLRERAGSQAIEVVNAGVVSYCPLLEYLQYRHSLHVLEPDLVVLNFDMSDVQDHLLYTREAGAPDAGTLPFVTEPTLREARGPGGLLSVQWLTRKLDAWRERRASAAEAVPFYRDADRYLWTLDNGPDLSAFADRTLAPVADLQQLLAHHHVPLLLATYPQPWQVAADATPLPPIRDQYGIGRGTVHLNDRPFRQVAAFAASHQLPFVNATPAFREAAEPAGLFLPSDFHFSPRGHALYAEVLARAILQDRLLPASSATAPLTAR